MRNEASVAQSVEREIFNLPWLSQGCGFDPRRVQPLIAPYLAELDRPNISHTFETNFSATFLDYFASIMSPLPYGPYPPTEIWNNWLMPLLVVLNSTATSQLKDAFKPAVADGTFLIGCNGLSVADNKQ
ncbi:hypothetical protein F4818DRAFT_436053 [Hypoxylon cercidicola]|nr:hypothetical protein F4818DRAFT_436053 [Hypoxylon cercidicola]